MKRKGQSTISGPEERGFWAPVVKVLMGSTEHCRIPDDLNRFLDDLKRIFHLTDDDCYWYLFRRKLVDDVKMSFIGKDLSARDEAIFRLVAFKKTFLTAHWVAQRLSLAEIDRDKRFFKKMGEAIGGQGNKAWGDSLKRWNLIFQSRIS